MVDRFFAKTKPFARLLKQNVDSFPEQITPQTTPLRAALTRIVSWREYPPTEPHPSSGK